MLSNHSGIDSQGFFNFFMYNSAYNFFLGRILIMSDKSELKAELERKKQRLAQIREEKKRKEEERKKKEVRTLPVYIH